MRLQYPIPMLCRLFGVSRSGFYDWKNRQPSQRSREEARLEVEIIAAHKRTRQSYGAERLQHDLAAHGVQVGVHRIKRIRRKLGLRCKQKRKFKATTDSNHAFPVAENLLNQDFRIDRPSAIWLSDITYIYTDEGWLYLAAHRDMYTGEIVGYAMGSRMTKVLVMESLRRAYNNKKPPKGLIHHSDRGSQYCSKEYRCLLERLGMKASMSAKGNCYDNAPMESFWSVLKMELIFQRHFATRQQAIREVTEYIEVFYNRQRIQPRLGYLSPAAFERQYYEFKKAA